MQISAAAAISAFVSIVLLHWMETVKYRRQLGDNGPVLREGILALYRGLGLNLVANTVAWSVSLSCKTWLQESVPYWLALLVSTTVATVLSNWLWVAKARQQTSAHPVWTPDILYTGLLDSIYINAIYGSTNYVLYDSLHSLLDNAAIAGFVSKISASVLTHVPQRRRLENQLRKPTLAAGLRWSLARAALQNAVIFQLYETLKDE